MTHKPHIESSVEETLHSIDEIQKANPASWFFSRLQARLLQKNKNAWEKLSVIISRPPVAIAGMLLIVLLNGFVVFKNTETVAPEAETKEQAFANEYSFAVTTIYDYENNETNE